MVTHRDTQHFNNLSEAELERLAILAEECGECIHIIGKIIRHGYESRDPTKSNSLVNRDQLEDEIGDILAAVERMIAAQDVKEIPIMKRRLYKLTVQGYLHHNNSEINYEPTRFNG